MRGGDVKQSLRETLCVSFKLVVAESRDSCVSSMKSLGSSRKPVGCTGGMFAFNSSVIPPVGARFFGSTYQGGISLVDDTLAIGAWGTNASRGSTHIFRRNLAFDWALEANLMPEEEGASFFGISVAMSYLPGQTRLQLAVGSPNDQAACAGNQYCGAVELYERSTDGAWLHRTRLVDAPSPQSAATAPCALITSYSVPPAAPPAPPSNRQ